MAAPGSSSSLATKLQQLQKRKLKARSNAKTKSSQASAQVAAPPAKKRRLGADELSWKEIKTSQFAGMDEGGGMMMLEELDDVGVEWDEEGGTKIARFVAGSSKKPSKKGKEKALPVEEVASDDEADLESGAEGDADEVKGDGESAFPTFSGLDTEDMDDADDEPEAPSEPPFNNKSLPEWKGIDLHSALKKSLKALGYSSPTDIQKRSLGPALEGRDIVGVAETGSGKTLAYSLPILSYLLRRPLRKTAAKRPLSGLILCPTRELAIQVVDHLQQVLKSVLEGEKKGPPRISIGSVVGGLSAQKQKRIVERGCDILVATPGRLWDLIRTDEDLAAGIRSLRFLVIDEADRMIENGHFAELETIVRLTQRASNLTAGPDDDDPVFAAAASTLAENPAREDMQTFVFSATLSKDLQHNLKRRKVYNGKKPHKKATALEDLVERLDFRDANPEVIDLSPEGGVVKMLKESMVDCVVTEKDLYLYYFLLRYPGRSLVFVGSIDGIRRLVPLFETLQMPIYPLHSQLQQKQRLKNLDRFKSSKNGVLIATDVAARGLDIPNVEHVVHFNLPRTADAYIHRSGRTARAKNPGFALQIVAPEDKGLQRALMKSLDRSTEIPDLPIEAGFLPKLKERIALARDIEKAQHAVKKDNHDKNWLRETAEAMDLDIDPSMLSDVEDEFEGGTHRKMQPKKKQDAVGAAKVPALKAELKALLAEPLIARGVSARYPTSGSKVIIDDLINATGHTNMLGAKTNTAYDEVLAVKKAKLQIGNQRKRKAAQAAKK